MLSVVLLLYKGRLPKLIRWASAAVAPALAFVLLEYVTHLVTNDVPLPAIGLNLVLYYLAALVLFFLFGRTDIAVAGITIAAVCVGYISYYDLLSFSLSSCYVFYLESGLMEKNWFLFRTYLIDSHSGFQSLCSLIKE